MKHKKVYNALPFQVTRPFELKKGRKKFKLFGVLQENKVNEMIGMYNRTFKYQAVIFRYRWKKLFCLNLKNVGRRRGQ